MDLDIEAGSETECRDRGLGGTLEVNTEDGLLGTPMMSMANQTGDSSCPLWLRKVCYHEGIKKPMFESKNGNNLMETRSALIQRGSHTTGA